MRQGQATVGLEFPALLAAGLQCHGRETGNEHDLGVGADLVATLREFDAVHLGHLDVGEDQVEIGFIEQDQCVLAIGGGIDLVAFAAEDFLGGLADVGIVVDD